MPSPLLSGTLYKIGLRRVQVEIAASLGMFRYFFHSFAIATLLLSVVDTLRLTFERGSHGTGNIITLTCLNDQGTKMTIDSIKFFVNRTSTPDEQSLDQMVVVHPSEDRTNISFVITGELEGYYVCGTLTPQATSNFVPLIGEVYIGP